jgi:hypothetical protein
LIIHLILDGGKKFFLSKTRGSWLQAAANCHKSGLKFASLDTADEQAKFIDFVTKADQNLFGTEDDKNVWVGGLRKPKGTITDWTWVESGDLISYNLNWEEGRQDDGASAACLALRRRDKNEATKWQFKNYECSHEGRVYYYFCQK